MKLSKQTLALLKNFSTINSGIYFKSGNFIMTKSVNSAVYGEATLPDGENIDFDFAIFDLNGFLSILSLTGEDAEISSHKNGVLIKGKRTEVIWPEAEPQSIVYPKKAINFPEAQVEFTVSGEDYNQLMKLARGLGADTIAITNVDDKVVIKSFNKTIDTLLEKPLSTIEVDDYEGDNNFNFIIDLRNVKLQADDYTVKLWGNASNTAVKFDGTVANYVIAVEVDSTHDFN